MAGGSNGTTELASAEIYDRYSQSFSRPRRDERGRQGHTACCCPITAECSSRAALERRGRPSVDLFLPAVFPDPFSYGEGELPRPGDDRGAVERWRPTRRRLRVRCGGGAADAEVYRFATIKTDKDDYAPGELAMITGSGWQPNEEVTLFFQEDPAVHDDYVLKVDADGDGNIYWTSGHRSGTTSVCGST